MKNKLKLLFAVVLSLTMVMGMCVTSFSATVVMKNPNSSRSAVDWGHTYYSGRPLQFQCDG